MTTLPTEASALDAEPFLRWYNSRRLRSTGRPASANTLRTKKVHIVSAARYMGAENEESLAHLLAERNQVDLLLDELAVRMSTGACRVAVYALLDFAEYAVTRRLIPAHCLTRADVPPKNPVAPVTVYTAEEMDTFVSAAKGTDLRWWAFLAFLADTGRRVGEALSLEWDWFHLDSHPPYIELPFQKNGIPQYIPFGDRLTHQVFTEENVHKLRTSGRASLRRSPERLVFPWSYGTVYGRFDRFCDRTGLPNRGFHNFRHTVITRRLIEGVPLQAVASLAGHSSPAITMSRYNHATAMNYARYV